jgi:hypothetical protein
MHIFSTDLWQGGCTRPMVSASPLVGRLFDAGSLPHRGHKYGSAAIPVAGMFQLRTIQAAVHGECVEL